MAKHSRSTAGGHQPISRHPLFPAIVALWCGALFGLASLAIGPALIERLVLATGIDKVIPMAAPPLGNTVRILTALAMTGMGVLGGALVALNLARRGSTPAAGAPEDALADSIGQRRPARRHRVAPAPTVGGESPAATAVPAPGKGTGILNLGEFDLNPFEDGDKPGDRDIQPLAPANSLFEAYSRTIAPTAEPGFELLPHAGLTDAGEDEAASAAETPAENPAAGSALPIEGRIPAHPSAADRIVAAELDELSPLQLVERLAIAMARRREQVRHLDPAESAMPSDPVTDDGRDSPHLAPPRLHPALRPVGAVAEEDGAVPEVLEQGYSSLLGLTRPLDGGETAVPEANSDADPDDTERALRAALVTLQRMSGTA